jgi:hypothetical protein
MVALEFCRLLLNNWLPVPAVKVALEGLRSKLGAGLTVMLEVLLIPAAVAVKVTVVLEATLEGGV